VVAASRKKPLSSAVATTVNSANLVYYPLLYNHVHVPVSANITSLPQLAPIMVPQTIDHSTDQVPTNTTTLGSNTGNNTYLPIQIGSSLDQMHTPHQIVGTASDITVNVTQNIKQKIKKGEYVDLASLLTNNQHHDSKATIDFQARGANSTTRLKLQKNIFNRHTDNSVYNIYKYLLFSTSRKISGPFKIYEYGPIRGITMRKSWLENVR
jgi:hypothetical protein